MSDDDSLDKLASAFFAELALKRADDESEQLYQLALYDPLDDDEPLIYHNRLFYASQRSFDLLTEVIEHYNRITEHSDRIYHNVGIFPAEVRDECW